MYPSPSLLDWTEGGGLWLRIGAVLLALWVPREALGGLGPNWHGLQDEGSAPVATNEGSVLRFGHGLRHSGRAQDGLQALRAGWIPPGRAQDALRGVRPRTQAGVHCPAAFPAAISTGARARREAWWGGPAEGAGPGPFLGLSWRPRGEEGRVVGGGRRRRCQPRPRVPDRGHPGAGARTSGRAQGHAGTCSPRARLPTAPSGRPGADGTRWVGLEPRRRGALLAGAGPAREKSGAERSGEERASPGARASVRARATHPVRVRGWARGGGRGEGGGTGC